MAREHYTLGLPPRLCAHLRHLSKLHRVPAAQIVRDVLPRALAQWEAERELESLRRAPRIGLTEAYDE